MQRAQGAAVGAAVGDAIGAGSEFMKPATIMEALGPDGVCEIDDLTPYGPGAYTDDTQMALAIARGLLASAAVEEPSEHEDATQIAGAFVAWKESQSKPGQSRAPGSTCLRACSGIRQDYLAGYRGDYITHGVAGSMGNGAVMRVWPVSLRYVADAEARDRVAMEQAAMTHGHEAAWACAVLWANMIAAAVRGDCADRVAVMMGAWNTLGGLIAQGIPEAWEVARTGLVPGQMDRAVAHLAGLVELLRQLDGAPRPLHHMSVAAAADKAAAAFPGSSWASPGAVAAALVIVHHFSDDYPNAVRAAANIGGDSDTVGAMVGALVGALHPEQIPERWISKLEDVDQIKALAAALIVLNKEA